MANVAMKSVFSSNVSQVGYNAEARELIVVFRTGKKYAYVDVPPKVADDIIQAPSVGNALHTFIRGQYQHKAL